MYSFSLAQWQKHYTWSFRNNILLCIDQINYDNKLNLKSIKLFSSILWILYINSDEKIKFYELMILNKTDAILFLVHGNLFVDGDLYMENLFFIFIWLNILLGKKMNLKIKCLWHEICILFFQNLFCFLIGGCARKWTP